MTDGYLVTLYVYDLSRGLAKALSSSMLGRQIGKFSLKNVYFIY
jgi:hypothetical protein